MTKLWTKCLLTACSALALVMVAGATVTAATEAVPDDPPAAALTLESVVAEALESSAELEAVRAHVRAAEASIAPAGALPDPMLSLSVSNVPVGGVRLDETPMSGVELGLSQFVPGGGKRRLRRQLCELEVVALRARYQDRRNDLVRHVRRAYYDLQYLDAAAVIAEQNKDLAQDLLATAEARYATGGGLQQDVFRAQVRLSRMIDSVVALRQRRAAAAVRLNRLLYRPASQPVPAPPPLTRTHFPPADRALGIRAVESNPRLAEARTRVEQMQTQARLAAEGIRPNFTLGFKYRFRQEVPMDPVRGEDFWSASAAINLPWIRRSQRVDQEVAGAQAQRLAAASNLEALLNEITARTDELLVEIMRDNEQLSLLETGLLPQAEGALASSMAAYATGQVSFLTLIDNQMNLYQLQLQRLDLIADHERNLADLEYLVGEPLAAESPAMEVSGDAH